MIIMVHKTIFIQDNKKIFIAGQVRQFKCPYNCLNSVRLMSVPIIKMHFIKIAFSHSLQRFVLLKPDSTM